MRYFLSGGSKSGKSMLAQHLARDMAGEHPLYYIATMIPMDEEDHARIRRHLRERDGWGFETVECGASLTDGLAGCDFSGSFLLDSVTALLTNFMFPPDGNLDLTAPMRLMRELEDTIGKCKNLVIVSDDLFSDARLFDSWTEAYREGLARCCRRCVELCDTAIDVTADLPTVWKGELG